MSQVSTKTLIEDLRSLVAATAGDASDRASAARRRAAGSVESARARLVELEEDLKKRAQAVKEDATQYVQDNPWQSIGVAAAVGIVVGVLLGRR